ncbi:MAG: hypothetical protein ACP5OC_05870 [Thermoplasmata archaeon]
MSIDCSPTTLPEPTDSILLEPQTQLNGNGWASVHFSHLGFDIDIQLIQHADEKGKRFQDNQSIAELEGHAKLSCLLFIYMMCKIRFKVA